MRNSLFGKILAACLVFVLGIGMSYSASANVWTDNGGGCFVAVTDVTDTDEFPSGNSGHKDALASVVADASKTEDDSESASAVETEDVTEAETETEEDDDDLAESLKSAQNVKENLENQISAAQSTIADLKTSKGNVSAKISELNQQLVDISAQITDLENQLVEKSEEIIAAQEELEAAKEREADQYADMKVRIQYMYENSQTSYMSALLGSGTITELLNAVEYISDIQSYDRQKLDEYQDTVTQIADMEEQLDADYAELEDMKAMVEEEKDQVAALMQTKEVELANISTEISDTQSDVDYFEAELQAAEELIAAIKLAEAQKKAAGKGDSKYTGGVFTWPCPSSTRITSDFGERESPTAGASTYHQGIDIGASYGADIVAAAAGTVISATYSSSAGNYVIIDHGGGVYTVYMHASSLNVSVGDEVVAGQVIAYVGSTGISTGNHLHFGVSEDGVYVSPWNYLGS